jgi:hypothetical protein
MSLFKNAITDDRIIAYPETLPELGPAGTTVIDPFCGNEFTRLTDELTDPAAPGEPFTSDSSGEAQPWACDCRHVIAINGHSNAKWCFEFNPESGTVQYPPQKVPFPQFTATNPNLIYGMSGFRFVTYNVATNQETVLCDLRDYPQLGIPDTGWYPGAVSMDMSDRRIAGYIGPGQDQSELVVLWDAAWGLCWFSTATGEYDGWTSGAVPNWQPFKIHDVRIGKSGTCLKIGGKMRSFWEPGTPVFQALPADQIPMLGHSAMGFSHYYGNKCTNHPFEFLQAPLFDFLEWHLIFFPKSTPGFWSDSHMSLVPDVTDHEPIYMSAYNAQKNPTEAGKPLTSLAPGDNEIFAIATDGTGAWWRLAHHYASGKRGFYSSPRGNVSPDGRYYLFTSDWEGLLAGRTDAFILATGRDADGL